MQPLSSQKNSNASSVFIDNPSDMSDLIGETYSFGFNFLKDCLATIMDDSDHDLFFHRDESHVYSFDESKLQNEAIYGRKEARNHCNEDRISKITASKLVPLRDADEFEEHVCDVADVICEDQKQGCVIDICIVVNKEKVKKVPSAKKKKRKNVNVEDAAIEMSNDPSVFSSITSNDSSGNKRKKPSTFLFPARKLAMSLFAPIGPLLFNSTMLCRTRLHCARLHYTALGNLRYARTGCTMLG